jgi:hypothetical protein
MRPHKITFGEMGVRGVIVFSDTERRSPRQLSRKNPSRSPGNRVGRVAGRGGIL